MEPTGEPGDEHGQQRDSLHGESAAKRQAVTELLFFSSVGDLHRVKKIVSAWNLQVGRGPTTCGFSCLTWGYLRR